MAGDLESLWGFVIDRELPPLEKCPLKIVWSGVETKWPTEAEAAAEIKGFDVGIEAAAQHVETMGLRLIARELRDLKKTESGSQR